MNKTLGLGKLPPAFLASLLERYKGKEDSRLMVGPRIGEDAAVIDFGEKCLIAKTDPITFATDQIGWYAVNINANDLAVRGARPKWFQSTILLPENKADEKMVESIFSQISYACEKLGIAVAGGHTEVTHGLNRPIVVGSMLGEVEKEKLVTTSGARPGDDIIITKGIVIEGTSIIAREKEHELRQKGYSPDFIDRCKNYLFKISVVDDALIANNTVKVNCMHDPTEGGLSNGLWEMAQASRVGLLVYGNKIPVLGESKAVCEEYGLNPFGTITSGTLILTVSPEETEKLLKKYNESGIKACVIGKVMGENYGLKFLEGHELKELNYSEKDEITKIFG